jgi:hypothetical protein
LVKDYALVKFTIDLLAPGAVISPQLTNYYSKWAAFHTRRTIWPVKPLRELLDINDQGSMALEDFAHVRVTSIMDYYDGITDGELDRMLTTKTIGEVFDMPRIIGTALTRSQPYQSGFARAGWVELYEIREDAVTFLREASVVEIYRLITGAPTE